MKNKKVVIIAGVVGLIAVLAAVFLLVFNKKKMIEVTFNSDGGSIVESVKIEKGGSVKLPDVKKDGHSFLGWYIGDIRVTESTKYTENTTLTAKWLDESVKTFKVTFDTDGGSNVEGMIVECGKELRLPPNPTKQGYEFVSWIDKNETPILDQALLACEDITLKANWKKEEVKEEPKKETKKEEKKEETKKPDPKPVYSCSEGTLNADNKCVIEGTVNEKCPDDTSVDGALCIRTSDNNGGTRKCKEWTVQIDGYGHTSTEQTGDFYMVGNSSSSYGKCAYHKWEGITQSQCDQTYQGKSKKVTWVSELGGCYAETKIGNYETVCSGDYQYYSSDELSSKFGIHDNGKCLKKVSKTKYCDDGYTLSGDKCIKTIDATVTYQ